MMTTPSTRVFDLTTVSDRAQLAPSTLPSPCPHAFDRDGAGLVTIHDASCCLRAPSLMERWPPALVAATMLSSMVAISALIAWLPLKSLWVFGVAVVAALVVAAIPSRGPSAHAIAPTEIADLELRDVYRALLAAHSELAHAVVHHGSSPLTCALLDQSRDVLIACGQSAYTTNAGTRYLAARELELDDVTRQAAQALDHARAAGDELASAHWVAVGEARQRQLATMQDLRGRRDRVRAELEAAVAHIEVTTAEVVKQHTLDAAAAAGAGGDPGAALQDTLDGLRAVQAALPPA